MLRPIATGSYILGLSMLILSLLGILNIVDFDAISGLILYFVLKELSEFVATIVYAREAGEE
jgi:hypothetical protein